MLTNFEDEVVRTIGIISASKGYNLGLAKLATWAKYSGVQVIQMPDIRPMDSFAIDVLAISVVFSWDLDKACRWANSVTCEVWIGGPAVFANHRWISQNAPHAKLQRGIDPRFERETGHFKRVRWGRGCNVGCWFCIVPKMDGKVMIEYPDTVPAQVIIDDNILGYSAAHQERIVETTLMADFDRVHIESGFEPSIFSQWHFDLYNQLPMKAWRLAFDEMKEADAVRNAMTLLRDNGVRSRAIQVYVLSGASPFADCMERAQLIVKWGGEPRVQMYRPLTWRGDPKEKWIHPKYDWTPRLITNFPRYWYSYKWRSESFDSWLARQA
jgi:hypothetical protein